MARGSIGRGLEIALGKVELNRRAESVAHSAARSALVARSAAISIKLVNVNSFSVKLINKLIPLYVKLVKVN